jgi:integrase
MKKTKLREQIRKLRALADGNANPHEAELAREKVREFEALLSASSVRGIFEKVPGSAVWWIRFTDGQGKYRREVAGSYSQAVKLLDKRRGEAVAGKKLGNLRARTVLFKEIGDDALVYSRANKRSSRDDVCRMAKLVEMFGSSPANDLDGHQMEQRLNAMAKTEGWAASTFNHYRSLLMLCYREALRAKKVTSNPAREIRHRKEDNNRVRFLDREPGGEYERLINVVRRDYPEHLAELIFSLNTGLRLGSQYTATWEMIDWTRNVLDVPRTKNDEPVHTPLNANALAALRTLPSWAEKKGPIFRSQRHPNRPVLSNDHWFKPALRDAAIVGYTWHDNRHSFASWLIQDGVPLERVSKLLGHGSLTMTMRYAHLAPNKLHEDVALLSKSISTTTAPEQNQQTSVTATYVN